ncbi:peptidoglycan-binding protein [Ferrovibrio xuzhouensis]|uniref:Peptidoglycan-binding protein n=1 Tax=Ferrovibrio xuzhouensis TaxID=1576914 RepID=A0ABV7VFR6_9PROT
MENARASEESDLFWLSGPVGRNGANDRADVIKAQTLLANTGYLDLPAPGVPTGWPSSDLFAGITRLQKDNGLAADGILLPLPDSGIGANGEGETMRHLKDAIGPRFDGHAAATPEEVDRFHAQHGQRAGDESAASSSGIVTLADQARTGAPAGTRPAAGTKRPSEAQIAQNRAIVGDLLDDPRVQAFLDTLASRESSGRYNVINGGQRFDDYTQHPNVSGSDSKAAGAYQFIPETWARMARELGLPDFSPASQDMAALHLLRTTDLNGMKDTNAIARLQRGDIEGAILVAGNQWDAFPKRANGESMTSHTRPLQPIVDQYNKRLQELR